MDKVQKIREEVERLKNDTFNGGYDARYALDLVTDFINSLPEERPYKTGDKVWYLNELYTLEDDGKHYILTSVRDNVTASVVHLDYGCEDFKLLPYEEPVSEELKEAAIEICSKILKGETVVIDGYEYVVLSDAEECFKAGTEWHKANLWKPADGDDLPEIDREVIVLIQDYPNDKDHLRVAFAHRPNKYAKVWNSDLGEEQVIEIDRYDKGGWNIPNIVLWLDVELPKEIE